MQGNLNRFSFNEPNKYPELKSLLKRHEPQKPMTVQQWSAFATAVLGKPVKLEIPTPDEVKRFGR